MRTKLSVSLLLVSFLILGCIASYCLSAPPPDRGLSRSQQSIGHLERLEQMNRIRPRPGAENILPHPQWNRPNILPDRPQFGRGYGRGWCYLGPHLPSVGSMPFYGGGGGYGYGHGYGRGRVIIIHVN